MGMTRSSLLLASMLLAAALAGCGNQEKTNSNGSEAVTASSPSPTAGQVSGAGGDSTNATPSPSAQEEEKADTIEISVFGSDADLQEMTERKASVPNGSEAEQLKAALSELMKESDDMVSMWKDIRLLSMKFEDGIVTIDIRIPDESRVGAPAETLMIETMKSTLFQFSFVNGFDILVDGEAAESMMGHVELEHPYVK
ncbi:GerMN domain-containing protein [Paenibacillus soyae]|uniref:GerMN domain-containing protein n=1 Tax=Paenibacillus soyae TaxID=2969249 RepID=A0A9X2MMS5_9BACL|nr:GerMN domain-containing protein [Paenibacillus soyae]MCR2802952.1 GerMN domain-containing protein [Paenibacillus soyae]